MCRSAGPIPTTWTSWRRWGPPGGRGGILAASIRVDSLWLRGVAPASQSLAIHLTSEQGRQLVLRRPATDHVPPAMKLRRAFTSPSGHKVQIDLVQRREFARQVGTPWPHYFLTAGVLLSLFGGILLFQYLRTQDYSEMLARANRGPRCAARGTLAPGP
jgi:hypothetical protein